MIQLVATAVSIAVCAGVVVSPSASAAPDCPKSLRSIPGGSGDDSSNGFDDGAKGEGAEYVGGRIIIGLDASANRADLVCIANELHALIELGENPKVGMYGVDHLAVLQLPPGQSVQKTVALLNRSKYQKLIEFAEPDTYYETNAIQLPNDPMFNVQWGLMNRGFAPVEQEFVDGSQPPHPLAASSTASMRFPQAWEYLRRFPGVTNANPAGLFPRINIGIIDNSFFEHPELVRNSDLKLGGVVTGYGKGMHIAITAQDRERYRIILGSIKYDDQSTRPFQTCFLQGGSSLEEIESALTKGVDAMCGYDDVGVYDLVVTGGVSNGRNYFGKFKVRYGRQLIGEYAVDQSSADLQKDLTEKLGAEVSVTTLVANGWGTNEGDVISKVWRIIIPADAETSVPSVEIGDLKSPDPLKPASVELLRAPEVNATEYNPIPPREMQKLPGLRRLITVKAEIPTYISKLIHPPFSTTLDQSVFIFSGGTKIRNEEGDWPGRAQPTVGDPYGGAHGENIAGMIGAESNNGVGMSGAIGQYHNIKMYGFVVPNLSTVSIVAAIDEILKRNAADASGNEQTQVVNLSLGSARGSDDVYADSQKADPLRTSAISLAISKAPEKSPTLFVVAAGNEGGNVNDANVRNNQAYAGEKVVGQDPCRPKGEGVRNPPSRGGLNYYYKTLQDQQQGKKTTVSKGGTLNYLKMPDGTYDRGNLLCVGSVDWAGRPSIFTNWGRGVVDVAAPGSLILGTTTDNKFASGSGTSYSAPLVAAAAALVYSALRPEYRKPWLVKCALLSSATTQPLAPPSEDVNVLSVTRFNPRGSELARLPENDPRAGYTVGANPNQMGRSGEMFTVNGIVNAQLAIKAGQSIARKIGRGERPTCVQQRTFFGGWKNTRTQ